MRAPSAASRRGAPCMDQVQMMRLPPTRACLYARALQILVSFQQAIHGQLSVTDPRRRSTPTLPRHLDASLLDTRSWRHCSLDCSSIPCSGERQATPMRDTAGPYLGAACGAALAIAKSDGQLIKHFGPVRSDAHSNQDTGAGPSLVTRSASGQSICAAGTAPLPLGQSFALTRKVGISFGRVVRRSPSVAGFDF